MPHVSERNDRHAGARAGCWAGERAAGRAAGRAGGPAGGEQSYITDGNAVRVRVWGKADEYLNM